MTLLTRQEFIKLSGKASLCPGIPLDDSEFVKYNYMSNNNNFDVIIVGGSYSGLAAGMALGRAMKNILIVDSGHPCNAQTSHSHNFITHDGKTPSEISTQAKQQLEKYETVRFFNGVAINGIKTEKDFEIKVASGEIFHAQKLIFATGIRDVMPDIKGFDECWGISVLHCPFCHGYEVRNETTGIILNGESGYEFSKFISNWTKDLLLLTNGPSKLTIEQRKILIGQNIRIVEKEICSLEHINGYVKKVVFKDGTNLPLKVIYAPTLFEQHCKLPELFGCELTNEGYLKIDASNETSIKGIYACGDNVTRMRTVANAVAMGTSTGMIVSKTMILANHVSKP